MPLKFADSRKELKSISIRQGDLRQKDVIGRLILMVLLIMIFHPRF